MSAIAKNSSISLLTGVPGNGKSLRAVWYMQQAVKAGEQVFASNVTGLAIEGVTDYPDPTKWEELPPGSILVVDEAQRFFRASPGAVPAFITAMETIRHGGIRLILITQSPALIHPNIRALVGLHEHLVRQNGKNLATVYRRSRCMDNVRSEKALLAEDHESWAYPVECYDLYKSAEVHTVKRTMSSKGKRGLMLAAVAAGLIGYAVFNGKHLFGGGSEKPGGTATAARAAGSVLPGGQPDKQLPRYANATEYAKAHLPRFPSMPWTAEVYDNRPMTADPALFCMASGPGLDAQGKQSDGACHCVTEQATVYDLSDAECRRVARVGVPYNPYKGVAQQQLQGQQQPVAANPGVGSGVPVGVALKAGQVAEYGDIGAAPPQKIYGSM